MPAFETTRRAKLADIRDEAERVRGSTLGPNPAVDTLATLLVGLVDAIDPDVAAYSDKRAEDRKRGRGALHLDPT